MKRTYEKPTRIFCRFNGTLVFIKVHKTFFRSHTRGGNFFSPLENNIFKCVRIITWQEHKDGHFRRGRRERYETWNQRMAITW